MIPFFNRSHTADLDKSSAGVKLSLNQFFDDVYFPHAKATKKQPHHDWSIFNKHIRNSLGRHQLDELLNPILDVWVREQTIAGYQRSTINKHIHLMNRMLSLARHWGYIVNHNPQQQNIKRLSMGDYTQRFLSAEEIERLLKACRASQHPFLYLFVRFLLLTGARKGEARMARWADVDFEKRIWTVPRSKNGRSRRIVLSNAAMEVLRDIRKKSDQMLLPSEADNFLFTNPATLTAYQSFYAAWFVARDLAGLSDLRIHDLRHTFASLLINKGVSLYEVQTLLGHSSVQMTQRYAHLAPDLLQNRTEIVGGIVGGGHF
ncbi:site-specific integrase [uncultured Lentibacter sp.]|jgi:integrase|uniref:tyrosine-type recombinase/integrase n=1 Tax=uncultured Lentibacter sp. TaxID=1659309 RepID=UPI00261B021F|nr:site-specific integrase [uncultured Lentibacter sp.]